MRDKRPGRLVRIADGLSEIVGAADSSGAARLSARAVEVWEAVVGDEIARHSAGVMMRDGELVVHVDSHSWATELSLLGDTLRAEINSVLGKTVVDSIRFTVSRRVEDDRRSASLEESTKKGYGGDKLDPKPLSREERSWVEASAESIKSEKLRTAAVRAAVRDLEWKKAQRLRKTTQARTGDVSDGKTGLLP